jgi:NAD+ kinase
MTYGITGNTTKDALWHPAAALTRWLHRKGIPFRLGPDVADGLVARGLVDDVVRAEFAADDLATASDVLLSFGGDGTLLRTAHQADGTPILGVNIGRLGFLTKVEVGELEAVLADVEAGDFGVEERMTLAVEVEGADTGEVPAWALNDVVVDKSGTTSMIQVEATVDGAHLNTYWADGLVVATPTGSTAYALSVGGPILVPGTSVVAVAPIAPHTLTARPIVLPCDAELVLRVETRGHPFAFACDGVSTLLDGGGGVTVRVRRSGHAVRLLTLPDRDYFGTIRDKLSWGQAGVF